MVLGPIPFAIHRHSCVNVVAASDDGVAAVNTIDYLSIPIPAMPGIEVNDSQKTMCIDMRDRDGPIEWRTLLVARGAVAGSSAGRRFDVQAAGPPTQPTPSRPVVPYGRTYREEEGH